MDTKTYRLASGHKSVSVAAKVPRVLPNGRTVYDRVDVCFGEGEKVETPHDLSMWVASGLIEEVADLRPDRKFQSAVKKIEETTPIVTPVPVEAAVETEESPEGTEEEKPETDDGQGNKVTRSMARKMSRVRGG
jgi:hypothetical protein